MTMFAARIARALAPLAPSAGDTFGTDSELDAFVDVAPAMVAAAAATLAAAFAGSQDGDVVTTSQGYRIYVQAA